MTKLMIGSLLGGLVLVSSILFISNTPSQSSVADYSQAVSLMTEHMQLHHTIDANMHNQQEMIARIVDVLDKMIGVQERKSK